jgi:hypothetical protein
MNTIQWYRLIPSSQPDATDPTWFFSFEIMSKSTLSQLEFPDDCSEGMMPLIALSQAYHRAKGRATGGQSG